MTDKPMKAYIVREDSDGNCVIAFATNGATARREGGRELNLEFDEVESCVRAPWADQYAPGPVPMRAMLDHGWWFDCSHCGVKFDAEDRRVYDEDDRDDELDPVESGKAHYCSPTCMMKHWAERRDRTVRGIAVIEAALTRWPMATGVTANEYVKAPRYSSGDYQWRAQFTLPGIRYPVQWALGAPEVIVSQCDVDVFQERYGRKA